MMHFSKTYLSHFSTGRRNNRIIKSYLQLAFIAVVIVFSFNTYAATVSVAKTGQTSCYNQDGTAISCNSTGQDGDHTAGVAWPTPRFTDNGNGTLLDNLTGLVWLKDANCMNTHYPEYDTDGSADGTVSWQHALDFVASIDAGNQPDCAASHGDWRLPNASELASLVNAEAADKTWLESKGFSNIKSAGYWTSTTSTNFFPGNGVFVDLVHGAISNTDKNDHGAVLPVRMGQTSGIVEPGYPANLAKTGQTTSQSAGDDGGTEAGVDWPSPRFTDNGDGTVLDNLTGLEWLKDANCIATRYSAVSATGTQTWQQALDFVKGINDGTYSDCSAGKTDWRLPNRNELRSLTDMSQSSPPLPNGHPFENVQSASNSYYWSSTSYASSPSWASRLWMRSGDITATSKTSTSMVWPVRGGNVGPGVGEPNINVDPVSIDFGTINIGEQSEVQTVTISNTGDQTLHISDIAFAGLSASINYKLDLNVGTLACTTRSPNIIANSSCTFGVIFKPAESGQISAQILITSDDPDEASVTVNLTGFGNHILVPAQDINVTPLSLDFDPATVNGFSVPKVVAISNFGEADLVISNIATSNDDFTVDLYGGDQPCMHSSLTLSSNTNCTVEVMASPTVQGAITAKLAISSDDPDQSTVEVALSGSGVITEGNTTKLNVSIGGEALTNFNFDDTRSGNETDWVEVLITNFGDADLTLSSIDMDNFDPHNLKHFEMDLNGGSNPCMAETFTNGGKVLSKNTGCTIRIRFAPQNPGDQFARLLINSNDTYSPRKAINLFGKAYTLKTGSPSCFIATAAYGSYLDPHVVALRNFRDNYLLPYTLGRKLVQFYYDTSPPIANYIAHHEHVRTLVRFALTPIVFSVEYPWAAALLFFSFCGGFLLYHRRSTVR